MKHFFGCSLLVALTTCQSSVPDQALVALLSSITLHPKLAACLDVAGHDPTPDVIQALRNRGVRVFPSSECSQRQWSVVASNNMDAQYVSVGPFTRTSPWEATLRVNFHSNPMASFVSLFDLRLKDGKWVLEQEYEISRS
jgi:hypothetical protein